MSCAGLLKLDDARCAAGDVVSGRVSGLAGSAAVALLRVERQPRHQRTFTVAEARASQPDGAFTLTLPGTTLPSARGEQCALHYVVCSRGGDGAVHADLLVVASARPHLDAGSARADRLLAGWESRHFHIELSEAELQGGGSLCGRVHRHRSWAGGAIVVTARCLECWRALGLADHRMPQWIVSPLWEQAHPLRIEPDATWAPFGFRLPDGLPPAVEASTIAWRYELVAQRTVRYWFDDTAALTPLLHEHRR